MSVCSHKATVNLAAAILAGGKSRRMAGVDKSFIRVGGISLIQRIINTLKEIFEEIILVTNRPRDYSVFRKDCFIISDIITGAGPLSGIYSALSKTEKEAVFFVACDMPFLHNGLIRKQLACFKKTNSDVLVPRIKGLIQPLHAVYKRSLKNSLYRYLKNTSDYSIKGFLKSTCVYYWDLQDSLFHRNIFRNLNTEEDLKEAESYAGKVKGLA
jgi:molybdopterin-guanine dinucleotide biosynthesis protein A